MDEIVHPEIGQIWGSVDSRDYGKVYFKITGVVEKHIRDRGWQKFVEVMRMKKHGSRYMGVYDETNFEELGVGRPIRMDRLRPNSRGYILVKTAEGKAVTQHMLSYR